MTNITSVTLPAFKLLNRTSISERASNNPIELWERSGRLIRNHREASRKLVWKAVTIGYEGAEVYRDDPSRFGEVITHARSRGRIYDPTIADVLRIGICTSTDAGTEGQRYKNARANAQILQPFFDLRVPADELYGLIVASRGLKGLDVRSLDMRVPKVQLVMPCEKANRTPAANENHGRVRLSMPALPEGDVEPPSKKPELRPLGGVRHPERPTQKTASGVKKLSFKLEVKHGPEKSKISNMQIGDCHFLIIECQQTSGGRKYLELVSIVDA